MRNVVLTSFIVGLFCSCHQPKTTQNERPKNDKAKELPAVMVVADSLIYGFINQVIKDGGPDSILICERLADKELIGFTYTEIDSAHLDTLAFSKNDIIFIKKQLVVIQHFKLNPKLVQNKTLIPTDTLKTFIKKGQGSWSFWASYRKKYGEAGFCSVSMPLFSMNKETVIFHTSYHCGGMCGHGGTYIYKKRKGKWTIVKELSSWIS